VLQSPGALTRPVVVATIEAAITRAMNFDVNGNFDLETPDSLTDIRSFAFELTKPEAKTESVKPAATELVQLLEGIKRYGETEGSYMLPGNVWDFSRNELAMSIFLPDPLRTGIWDWRAPYYLDKAPDPNGPQPHSIGFLRDTRWVDFIIEYHRETRFLRLLPATTPLFPVYDRKWKDRPRDDQPPGGVPGKAR
jgi:hypothetical protein